MPTKKNKKIVSKNPSSQKTQVKNANLRRFRLDESYASLFLGVVVVVVIAIILLLLVAGRSKMKQVNLMGFRDQLQKQLNQKNNKSKIVSPTPQAMENTNTYTVKSGDSLWSIAQSKYNNGYKWVEILAVNNMSNPDLLYAGTKLNLPNSEASLKKYTVKQGDSLWNIAVATYANGYRWTDIAKSNNLSNPDWINPGQILILP